MNTEESHGNLPVFRNWEVTATVAAAVVKEAVREDNAEGYREIDAKVLCQLSKDDVSSISFTYLRDVGFHFSNLVFFKL
jgi:hypothetical protein